MYVLVKLFRGWRMMRMKRRLYIWYGLRWLLIERRIITIIILEKEILDHGKSLMWMIYWMGMYFTEKKCSLCCVIDILTTFTLPSVMIVLLLWKDRKTEGCYTSYNGAVLAISLLLTALGFREFISYIQERDSSSYDEYLEETLLGEVLYDAKIPYLP